MFRSQKLLVDGDELHRDGHGLKLQRALEQEVGAVETFDSNPCRSPLLLVQANRSAHPCAAGLSVFLCRTVKLELSKVERDYIVDSTDTDMLLTEVGMRLVELPSVEGATVTVEANETEAREFLYELRYAFAVKITRVSQPTVLRELARRLLPDYDSLARRVDRAQRTKRTP